MLKYFHLLTWVTKRSHTIFKSVNRKNFAVQSDVSPQMQRLKIPKKKLGKCLHDVNNITGLYLIGCFE